MRHGYRVLITCLLGIALALVLAWSDLGGQDSLATQTSHDERDGVLHDTPLVDRGKDVVAGFQIFLPLIRKNATAVPACEEEIINGGFEADAAWERPVTAYRAAYSTAQAHAGSRSMRVGIVDAGDNTYSYSSARQLVSIPADADSATLRFWLYSLSGETSTDILAVPDRPLAPSVEEAVLAGDAQYVLVLDDSDVWIDTVLWQRSNDQAWTYHEADLLEYAGQTIKLHFGVYNDGEDGATGMYVDDVSLVLCSP